MTKPRLVIDLIESYASSGFPARTAIKWTERRQAFFQHKYWFDQFVGVVLLVASSPVILILWAIVKLTSRGPGFYRQIRVGLNGKEFAIFKLRSMRVDAEADGKAVWCTESDNRITKPGKVFRRLHLDELPQLLNVARGEMSLIGPRPERPSICKSLEKNIPGYFDRVMVKPGISGLSQVNLPPDETLDDVWRKQILDLSYINETNCWLEIRILVATAMRMLGIKGDSTMRWMRLCRRSLIVGAESASQSRTPHG